MLSLTEKRIANISLTEAPISTELRNLESTRKTTPGRSLRSTIQTRVRVLELNKKIRQPKKIEECNQKKNKRNTISIEMII
jgi:hypothetical protein